MTRILVVEDEESYRDPLTYQLAREGFDVVAAADGLEAIEKFEADGGIDIVLLDLMLPGLSGTEVCRRLRLVSDVPVIMLTAKDTEIDKVVGLELGADDYVTKPYSFRELLARVRAVLRRRAPVAVDPSGRARPDDGRHGWEDDDGVLDVGPVRMDVDRHTVTVDGAPVALPLKEFDLLELLLRNAGRVLTRGQLIDRVWGADYVGDTKTLDVHVKRLRAKIEPDPGTPRFLLTVRGLGYKLADSEG
ncbi:two component transcriptional regulator, winged helix family [Xylanimonas cellulosilytica DSM 15894]|uniref:Sensory transduction protein RegX3 n=1 Tax=Xylanimonas cellulosilytica (strain DSM 15894 / JCM 12276 / CECT 5975 / KCTC 9989 / LMG 20990 / NBRC 107835 / XIL07) TaxID=446471 RepID=D1BZ78_XYLCX|nr:response regulator transcription factor [Xylanimonas cellulosilytica]ACZ31975.1 two component transcriptional regulator, winged helix family [Xylanimonas cellulosilytica DSM 15894]